MPPFSGSSQDGAKKVVVEPSGRVIVTGYTVSPDFPVTPSAMQSQYGGNTDVFVSILNPLAAPSSRLVYSSNFCGTGADVPHDLKEDSAGSLYLAGYTASRDLPVGSGALQAAGQGGSDGFVLKFDPAKPGSGSVEYSSFISSPGSQLGSGSIWPQTARFM